MSGAKHKFYELSAGEREGEKLNDIYKMMSQQDKSLAELLEKYDGKYEKESEFGFDSKTIDVNREARSLSVKKEQSGSRMNQAGFELPVIGPVSARQPKKKNLNRNKPVYNIEKNPYFF